MSIRSSPIKSHYTPLTYGWFCGGTNVVDRISINNDTVTAVDRCNLTISMSSLAGFTDGVYGWIGGKTTVNRITLLDDTTNALDRCDTSEERSYYTGFSDTIYGWFCGGEISSTNYSNRVDRITIADDTTNAIDRCNNIVGARGSSGITDNTYGWISGGYSYNGTIHNRYPYVGRITLANDTVNAINRCNLTCGRERHSGITNNTHGWFAGGGGCFGATFNNNIDRITLANDTVNASDRCNLSDHRYGAAGITDNIYGWFGGGRITIFSDTDLVDRITLSNDTANAIDRCNLSVARNSLTGFIGTI